MKVYKCDKCGELIEESYQITFKNFTALIKPYDRISIDLCKECKSKLIEWLTGYKPCNRRY